MQADVSTTARRWTLPDWGVVAGITGLLYMVSGGYSFQSIDTDAASTPAWVLVRSGSLDLTAVPGLLSPELLSNAWYVETANGLLSNRFPGVIAYSIPFYWLADLLGVDDRWVPGVLAAATVTAAAVAVMLTTLAALGLPRRVTVGASLFFGLGTATWAVSADAQWPHGIDQLIIAVGLRLMVAGRTGWAGLVLGMLCLVRPQMAPAVLVVGVAWAWWDGRWHRLVQFGPPALLGLVLLVAYNGVVFDVWSFDHGYYEYGGVAAATLSGFVSALWRAVSNPSQGLLFLYPVLLVAATGLARGWRQAEAVVRAAALGGATSLLTQLLLNPVEGDAYFGTRLTIEPLTLAFPLLVLAWLHRATWVPDWLAVALLALTTALHAAGAFLFPYFQTPGASGVMPLTLLVLVAGTAAATTAWLAHRWHVEPRLAEVRPN